MNKMVRVQKVVQYKVELAKEQVKKCVKKHKVKLLILSVLAYLGFKKDLSIDVQLQSAESSYGIAAYYNDTQAEEASVVAQPMNTSLVGKSKSKQEKKKPTKKVEKGDNNLANTYSNMVYTEGEFATTEAKKKKAEKRRKQLAYVKRYAKIAQGEMDKYGIPASITLAQGLLESNVGESRLATKNNNHFGIKCFSRSCKKGHCSNFTDDSHKDFFRIYKNTWESYRAHSILLNGKRYKPLKKHKSTDYKNWAYGLKKAGYATDKHYAEKLINLITELNLDEYDY